MAKKNLILVNHNAEKFDGAGDEYIRLLKYFRQFKDEYYIFGLFPDGPNKDNLAKLCDDYNTYTLSYVPVMDAGLKSVPGYLKNYFTLKKEFTRILKNKKFDVGIFNVSVMVWQIYFSKNFNIKNIVFIREYIFPYYIRKIIYKFLVKISSYFFAVSQTLKKDFIEITGKENIEVFYSSIDESIDYKSHTNDFLDEILKLSIKDQLNDDSSKFICLGSISDRKNQMLILETANLFKNKGKENENSFYIVGDENDKDYVKGLKQYIKEHKLKNCFLLGPKDKSFVFNLFQYMDGMLICSKSEGLPLVLVEAFKHKLPVIATDAGGITDIIEDGKNGLMIERTAESILNKIQMLTQSESLAEEIKTNAYETYKTKFNAQKNLAELKAIVDNLIIS